MRVIIESPFSGDVDANTQYAKECLLDSLNRGECPFASHLLYTQVLNDEMPEERDKGIAAGFEWMHAAEKVIVYQDLGISSGMQLGINNAEHLNIPVIYRNIRD